MDGSGVRTVLHADIHPLPGLWAMGVHRITSEKHALMSREGCPDSLANLISSPLRSWVSDQRRFRQQAKVFHSPNPALDTQ